jgi:molybdopterin-guanine dinucleotide biosynthesis protein A
MRLFDLSKDCDGAVPKVNGYWEPLYGVYRRKPMISAIGKALSEGKERPIDAYKYLDIRELSEDKIIEFDPELVSFININSFKQLQDASNIRRK